MAKLGTAPTPAPMNAPGATVQNPFPQAPPAPVTQAPAAQPIQQQFPGMPGAPPMAAAQPAQYGAEASNPYANMQSQPMPAYQPQQPQQQLPVQPGFASPAGWGAPLQPMQGGLSGFADAMLGAPGGGGADDFMQIVGTVDLTQVQGGGGRLLPMTDAAGNPVEYESMIVKADFKRAKDSNNPMIALQLKVTFPLTAAGVTLYDNVVLIDTTMWKYKDLAAACDLISPDGRTFVGQGPQDFVDNIVRHQITHQPDQSNTPRNRVAGSYTTAHQTPGLPPLAGTSQAPAVAGQQAPNFGQR